MKASSNKQRILHRSGAKKLLPAVATSNNKASRGRSLIMAGSPEFPGAGVLAAKAALRTGSGYVMLAQKGMSIDSWAYPDVIPYDLNNTAWYQIKAQAILIGPGFGVNGFTSQIIKDLQARQVENVILDADALTVCAKEGLFPLLPTWIVTPHTGELARCLGCSAEEINADREAAVVKAQQLMNCVVLLKGHHTLIRSRTRTYLNKTGNAALAKAGTGDVLAGIITALRAQGLSAIKAAVLGAYLHGATANLWQAHKKDLLSMLASDVIDLIPEVIHRVRFSESP
ncbi:MAG: NAD(P)H-hydrate dehydratase [Bacillota bacterium]